jgi:hypothetical protein
MKKFLFVFALMGLFVAGANAQAKTCSKSCAKACEKKTASAEASAAAKAASMDDSIEKRVDASTNTDYYVRRVSDNSGKVTFDKVEFCSKEGKFVNVSPKAGGPACCAKDKAAGCCAKKGMTADASSK